VYQTGKKVHNGRPSGNSSKTFVRRFEASNDPHIKAIYERVCAGEITINAGAIEAGFREPPKSRRQSALDKIRKLIPELTAEDRKQAIQWLQEAA
jgi:hypothetical protein